MIYPWSAAATTHRSAIVDNIPARGPGTGAARPTPGFNLITIFTTPTYYN